MINFDFPADTDSYIHRVGRTARGNNKGSALSLIAARELERAQKVEKGNAFSVFHFKETHQFGLKYGLVNRVTFDMKNHKPTPTY